MSVEKKDRSTAVWRHLRTGALGLLLILALLMCVAFLISWGLLDDRYNKYMVPLSALLAGFAARKLTNDGREEGALLKAVLAAVCMTMVLFLLSAGIRDTRFQLNGILTTTGIYAAGDLLGSMVRINKKYRRKHDQRQKYNK